jgi:hypothetical protein
MGAFISCILLTLRITSIAPMMAMVPANRKHLLLIIAHYVCHAAMPSVRS